MQQNYFFEQQKGFSNECGRHSVNNIIGFSKYSKADFKNICYELSSNFINPHKHILGGDYDANVIFLALQRSDYQVKWHDKRKALAKNWEILLVNIQRSREWYHKILGFSARHWFVIKRKDSECYVLDSANEKPREQNNIDDFIKNALKSQGQIIYVTKVSQTSD